MDGPPPLGQIAQPFSVAVSPKGDGPGGGRRHALCHQLTPYSIALRSQQPGRMRAVDASEDFVWYGVRGLARIGGVGGGGLVAQSLDTREVRGFRRSSAQAIFTTANGDRVIVTSHHPQEGETFDRRRDVAVINALNWVPIEARRGVVRVLDEYGPATVRGIVWEKDEFTVEGATRSFDVCQFDNGYWVAVGKLPEADVAIESRGVPAPAVELERMGYPPPGPQG